MSITGLLSIFLAAILTNNYILSKFLGICPWLLTDNRIHPDHCSTCSVH